MNKGCFLRLQNREEEDNKTLFDLHHILAQGLMKINVPRKKITFTSLHLQDMKMLHKYFTYVQTISLPANETLHEPV